MLDGYVGLRAFLRGCVSGWFVLEWLDRYRIAIEQGKHFGTLNCLYYNQLKTSVI